ncbi:hypothetical protein L1D34_27605 [Vibrio mediterranei]|uniref:hypothetical protein n=1 Tax=Vibrio mediterranei TaxID=689 RepID=UPI001EFDC3E6|nr:hypothetical protein [Vibrio mediterranei]MCG9628581.1 hypothetical protein [Vibrio mediterranei]
MGDITYKEAASSADLPITNPIHKPCPDMAAFEHFDSKKTDKARFLISKLREKHGIKKRVKPQPKPLTYTCTERGCIEPWGTVSKGKP